MTDHARETDTIEEDIRETREGIDRKVQQIQDRLSPGDVVDGVVDFVRDNGGSLAGSLGRGIRDNPMPATLIGAGVLWLTLSSLSRREDLRIHGEEARERVQRKAADLKHGAGQQVAAAAGRTEQAGRAFAGQARQAKRAGGRFVQDHPVMVGAAGLLLGAALAASLPRWRREDDVYGAQSDRVKDTARHRAEKEGRKLQTAAKDAVEKARQAAEDKITEGSGAKPSQASQPGKSG